MTNFKNQYDAVIIGCGPAGSAMASYLSLNDISCLVVDKSKFPREHVGESLVPSAMRIFSEIGFLDKMHAAGFPQKNGVGWTSTSNGRESKLHEFDFKSFGVDVGVDIDFSERKQSGIDSPYTYHVDRGRLDALLADHAASLGAQIAYETKITNFEFLGDGMGANLKIDDQDIHCKVVVDASGRNTVLGRKLGFMKKDPVFNQYAIHSWFSGFERGPDENHEFTYVHFIPESDAWVWQIPVADDIMSIGVVSQMADFKRLDTTNEEFFWQTIAKRPDLMKRLQASNRARDFKVEADYCYAMTQVSGDGFVMIGDAARFVDPIFSNGVSIALNSAKIAGKDIIKALKNNEPITKSSFAEYERQLKIGTNNWYRFISLYYRLNVIYMHFLSDERYRLGTLKLLQGDVYDDENPFVLDEMQKLVSTIEANPDHVFHKFLGNLSAHIQSDHIA